MAILCPIKKFVEQVPLQKEYWSKNKTLSDLGNFTFKGARTFGKVRG